MSDIGTETGPSGGISFGRPLRPPIGAPPAADTDQNSVLSPALQNIFSQLQPAIATLSGMVLDGASSGSFDTTEKFKAFLKAKMDASLAAPSITELQANNAIEESKASQAMADYIKANPAAAPTTLTSQQYPQIQLPGVPQNVQPHPNGLASLGAGIAGLLAPKYAGRFAAEALSGAITAAGRENELKRSQYQLKLQQSVLKHQDDIRQKDAQAEVDVQNARFKNAYDAETHSDNLKAAFDSFNAAKLKGEAGNYQAYDAKEKQAKQLEETADQLGEQLKAAQDTTKLKLDTALRAASTMSSLVEHILTIQGRQDALAEKTAKDKADAADKVEQRRIQAANEARQEAHNKAMEDIQRSGLSQKDKEIALRATEINFAHQDRQAATAQRASGARGSVMHHETPEETSAKVDMNYLKELAVAAKKAASASPTDDNLKSSANAAQAAYNRARKNYQDIGDKARKADGARLPGISKTYRFNPTTGQVEEVK